MANTVKLFVFTNTYTARILLRCLENINKNDDFEIILLSELGISCNINLKIYVCDTLQQCIEACTHILVVCDYTIPKTKIDLISSLAHLHNKCCTIVPGLDNNQKVYPSKNNFKPRFNEKPVILIVSYGAQTQISCWETIIYKMLWDQNLKVFAGPSAELNNVFEWLALCGMADKIFIDKFVAESECEVEVRCLEYDPNENNEVNDILFGINPDVLFVSICNNYDNYDEIQNVFKFKYKQIIDIFLKSELIETVNGIGEKKLIFDFTSVCNDTNSIMKLGDPKLFKHLSKIIFPKIALPNGVSII